MSDINRRCEFKGSDGKIVSGWFKGWDTSAHTARALVEVDGGEIADPHITDGFRFVSPPSSPAATPEPPPKPGEGEGLRDDLRASTIPALTREVRTINDANGWGEPPAPGVAKEIALTSFTLVEFATRLEQLRRGAASDAVGLSVEAGLDACTQVRLASPEVHITVTRLLLIGTEVSEAVTAALNPGPSEHCPEISGLEEELADVVIRVMDTASLEGVDLERAIRIKLAFNKTRGYRRGGRAA